MFYWFILALFGFCSLRLAGVFSNLTYSIASALGLERVYRPLLNLLMCLALFGIFFFYNLTDVVILREIGGYNYNTSKWYDNSYALLNKDYRNEQKILEKKSKKKEQGLVKGIIENILKK